MSSTPCLGGIQTHNISDDRGTNCIGSYKSNYHTITTTTAPSNLIVYTPVIGRIRSYLCLSCCTKLSCVIKLVTTINICIQWMKTIFFSDMYPTTTAIPNRTTMPPNVTSHTPYPTSNWTTVPPNVTRHTTYPTTPPSKYSI